MLQTIGKMGIFFLWNHIRSLRSKTVPAGSDKALRRSDFVSRWVWWCWWRGGLVYGDYWSVVTSAWPIDHWILKILQKFEKLKKNLKNLKCWSGPIVGLAWGILADHYWTFDLLIPKGVDFEGIMLGGVDYWIVRLTKILGLVPDSEKSINKTCDRHVLLADRDAYARKYYWLGWCRIG